MGSTSTQEQGPCNHEAKPSDWVLAQNFPQTLTETGRELQSTRPFLPGHQEPEFTSRLPGSVA